MIAGNRFLEKNPVPTWEPENDNEAESIHKTLEGIHSVPEFFEKLYSEPDFLRTMFTHGRFLWIKRRPNLTAYFRITDAQPRTGSVIKRSTIVPLHIEWTHGEEGREVADLLVREGFAEGKRVKKEYVKRLSQVVKGFFKAKTLLRKPSIY